MARTSEGSKETVKSALKEVDILEIFANGIDKKQLIDYTTSGPPKSDKQATGYNLQVIERACLYLRMLPTLNNLAAKNNLTACQNSHA